MAPDPETAAAAVAAARARQSEVAKRISSMSTPAEEGGMEASSGSGKILLQAFEGDLDIDSSHMQAGSRSSHGVVSIPELFLTLLLLYILFNVQSSRHH